MNEKLYRISIENGDIAVTTEKELPLLCRSSIGHVFILADDVDSPTTYHTSVQAGVKLLKDYMLDRAKYYEERRAYAEKMAIKLGREEQRLTGGYYCRNCDAYYDYGRSDPYSKHDRLLCPVCDDPLTANIFNIRDSG